MEFSIYDQEYWDCKDQFRATFEQLSREFVEELEFSKDTKSKYAELLWWLTEYLYSYTNYLEIKTIKPGDVVSRFYNYARYDFTFPSAYKKYLLRFFLYLEERGYENQKVVQHLKKIT